MFVLPVDSETLRRRVRTILSMTTIGAIVLASVVIWFLGSSNPFTPAGYVGYLTKGAVFGKSRFYGVQKGPTSRAARGCSTSRT